MKVGFGKNHTADGKHGITNLDILTVDFFGFKDVVCHLYFYLYLTALAGKIGGGYFFIIKIVFNRDAYRKRLIACAAIIKVGSRHIPEQAAVLKIGFGITLNICYIFKVRNISEVNLGGVGVNPIGNGYILNRTGVIKCSVNRFGFFIIIDSVCVNSFLSLFINLGYRVVVLFGRATGKGDTKH